MKLVVEKYDSLDVFMKTIMERKPNKVFKDRGLDSENGTRNFTGSSSMAEALEIMKTGYNDPLADIKESMKRVQAKSNTPVQKIRPVIGVVGFAPCVPNAIKGLPNSMIAVERVPMKSKILTVMYSVAVRSGVETRAMIKAGTAVLKMVNDLELQGYRVRLNVEFMGTQEGNEFASVTVNVKDWRQHIDLKKLTFPLVHPSALRRIGFRWLETTPDLSCRSFPDGYGRAKNNEGYESAKSFYEQHGLLKENEYYINLDMVERCHHDTQQMMKMCGIAQIKKAM